MLTVANVFQATVLGTASEPVTFTSSIDAWNVPPAPLEATRKSKLYVPAGETLMVYSSHSPALVKPTSFPPPVSPVASTSTPPVR